MRDLFRHENPICQWPYCIARAEVLHEIARGAVRGKALDQPAALLHLCHKHHTLVHNRPSVARDLAVKQQANDGTYDLDKVNELRGRRVEQWEVEFFVREFRE